MEELNKTQMNNEGRVGHSWAKRGPNVTQMHNEVGASTAKLKNVSHMHNDV